MRICIDLDGVVCRLRNPGEDYADLLPVDGAVEKLQALKTAGHTVILYSARHMKSCDGNVGLVLARVGAKTLAWLAKHNIVFDEIYFGKPWADIYIDDNAFRFADWDSIASDGSNLPVCAEVRLKERLQVA